jgi:hypothetical protein
MDSRSNDGAPRTRLVRGRRLVHCRCSRRQHSELLPSDVESHARGRGVPVCGGFGVAMPIPLSRYPRLPTAGGALGRSPVSSVGTLLWYVRRVPVGTSRIPLVSSRCRPRGPVLLVSGGQVCAGPTPDCEGA